MPRKPKKPTTAPPTESVVSEARRKSAALLNLNPGDLSPAGALKCDMVSALRLVIDDELARATSGSGADLGKLITAVEHLAGILKEAHPTRSDDGIPAIYKKDPYVVMEGILDRWLATDEEERSERGLSPRIHDEAALQRRVDDLEAELVRLRGAQPHADPERVIVPPTSAITPPGEQSDNPRNMRPPSGTDPKPPVTIDGKPLRPGMGPDGKPIPPQALSGDETKRRMAASNADRATAHRVMNAPSRVTGEPQPSSPMTTYGDSGFCWQGSKGRSW